MQPTDAPVLDVKPAGPCAVCGTPGTRLHDGVQDGFGLTRNAWSFVRCPRRACRHAWLDPAPTDEALPIAYHNYPIHAAGAEPPPGRATVPGRAYRAALRGSGMKRRRDRLELFGLPPGRGQRLLEVGCGTGFRLLRLRAHGYQVEGQEVSSVAAAKASALGATVHLGDLDALGLPAQTFDAVVMNHVLEHVRDPVAFLASCRRLLRPGGAFVSIQPNGASLSHAAFGADWVGLDPPRHLHVFTPRSLAHAAGRAGFRAIRVSSTYARNEGWTRESLRRRALRRGEAAGPALAAGALAQLAASLAALAVRNGGDEAILECAA